MSRRTLWLIDGYAQFFRAFHAIRTDMRNAGANWVDEAVVVDGNLITSRNPGDLEAFCSTTLEAVVNGPAARAGSATVHPIRAGA